MIQIVNIQVDGTMLSWLLLFETAADIHCVTGHTASS